MSIIRVNPDKLPRPALPQFTSLEFMDLFTEGEQLSLAGAAMQNPMVKLWYDRLLAASFITLDDPRTEAGLDVMVSIGLLTAERKVAIVVAMGGTLPEPEPDEDDQS